MEAVIKDTLKGEQIKELFENESVYLYSADRIPEYRVIELFGEYMAKWLDECCVWGGYMKDGVDYNSTGDGSRHMIRSFYLKGFQKIASYHNARLLEKRNDECEAGRIVMDVWEERCRRLAELDAEDERKRQERRAKRAAAKAKREAAVKAEKEGADNE